MIDNKYRYQLEDPRLTGRRKQKFTCPRCGRKHCFVRYVDTQDQCRYLDPSVGRCDHEQSCQYHYRPAEFFHDNPWMETNWRHATITPPKPKPAPPLVPLDKDLPAIYHSPRSTFWQWLTTSVAPRLAITRQSLLQVYEDYCIGATIQGDVVFWQIDHEQRVRTGHIMQYAPDGHRRGRNNWIHSYLKQQGKLPEGFCLRQCLYGMHLLSRYPGRRVCIVESEKTAVIMAAAYPQHLWMATGGSSGLSAEKLRPLQGRRITVFPDSGILTKWTAVMKQTTGIQYTVDTQMEAYPPNTDLADLLLTQAAASPKP